MPEPVLLEGIKCYHPERAQGCEDYPEEGLTGLREVEDGHFWFESRNRMLECLLTRYLPGGGAPRKFLEIGCGTGFVLRMLSRIAGLEVYGSEIHLSGAKIAAARVPGVEVVQLDALAMSFHGAFDAVGLFDVLEHIEDDAEMLRRIRAALVPGGLLFLTVPQYPSLWSPQDTMAGHKRRYVRAELEQKVRAAGFQPVYGGSLFCAVFPLYVLSRRKKKSLSGQEAENEGMAEFRLPAHVNAILTQLCRLDILALKLGLRLPFGSSLVMVARSAPPSSP